MFCFFIGQITTIICLVFFPWFSYHKHCNYTLNHTSGSLNWLFLQSGPSLYWHCFSSCCKYLFHLVRCFMRRGWAGSAPGRRLTGSVRPWEPTCPASQTTTRWGSCTASWGKASGKHTLLDSITLSIHVFFIGCFSEHCDINKSHCSLKNGGATELIQICVRYDIISEMWTHGTIRKLLSETMPDVFWT